MLMLLGGVGGWAAPGGLSRRTRLSLEVRCFAVCERSVCGGAGGVCMLDCCLCLMADRETIRYRCLQEADGQTQRLVANVSLSKGRETRARARKPNAAFSESATRQTTDRQIALTHCQPNNKRGTAH